MRRLLTILFLWASIGAHAGHFTFGSPGGSAVLTSMSGHSLGDTGYIAPGNYTFLQIQNLDSIHILPLDPANLPVFSLTSSVNSNRWCEIAYLNFIYASGGGNAWQMNGGKDYRNNYHHLYFYGWPSTVFTKHNNFFYTGGDTSTAFSYKDTWHDITIDSCGAFMQGSFGNMASNSGHPPDVFSNTTIYNIQDIATSLQGGNGQGTGIRGIFLHLTIYGCRITDRSGRGADGDVGWLYLTGGSAHMWDCIKWGGPGYLYRNNDPMSEYADPWDNWFFLNGKFNGTQYGMVNIQALQGDTLAGVFYGPNDYLWNDTHGNQINDTFNYWSTAINLGQVAFNKHHYTWNIFAFNIGNNPQKVGAGPNNNKNPLWVNLGGWSTMSGDTSFSKYLLYGTLGSIDSTSVIYSNRIGSFSVYRLTSATPITVRAAGTVGPIITPVLDVQGRAPNTPPDLGYVQLFSNCNCIFRPKNP